jgi:tetraprenyl-beta-curcumene synthase
MDLSKRKDICDNKGKIRETIEGEVDGMKVPTTPFSLMRKVYSNVMPHVHKELKYWRVQAEQIPNEELRKQALMSLKQKAFHCEGGGILALLAGKEVETCIRFIVAYQTISDYLDNLCDRSTSLDPEDFRALHESMLHALQQEEKFVNYYRFRDDQLDGGYLQALVQTCQQALREANHYEKITPVLHELASYYCDLQVHKHVTVEEREPRLQNWFSRHRQNVPPMEWYEFSACSGSTLGVFCLVAYAYGETLEQEQIEGIRKSYFPYVQGLHILLDYFIDQEEDKAGGDLNFCSYYENQEELFMRLKYFITEADTHISQIPHEKFHRLIHRGLLGVYLSDRKINEQREVRQMAKQLVKCGGLTSRFFYWNGKVYRRVSGT